LGLWNIIKGGHIINWKTFVITEYGYLLDQLTDSYKNEILHGHFRIEKGMALFNEMPQPYKALYDLHQEWQCK
jgi:hypothetical protein